MRIGYFGGSFDPPHRGHLAVAHAARDRFALDRVLLAPTGRQPLKPNGPAASFADRLRMTELLCAGQPHLEPSAIDAPQPNNTPNYTAETLRRLHAQLAPQGPGQPPTGSPTQPPAEPTHLFAILGADAFQTFPHWREPEALLQLADWIIVSRPGFPLTPPPGLALTAAQRTRLHLLEGVADPVSATDLRTHLQTGQPCPPCHQALPTPVLDYIRAHHLYT